MERNTFRLSEVISFLEMKLLENTATYDEEQLYVDYNWDGRLKKGYTYKKLINEMKEIHENGF